MFGKQVFGKQVFGKRVLRMAGLVVGGVAAVSCTATPAAGSFGAADTTRPVFLTPAASLAVPFTPSRGGHVDGVTFPASRLGPRSPGWVAYAILPTDPATGRPAQPQSTGSAEPDCWGYAANPTLTNAVSYLSVVGYSCPVQAGRRYWIELDTLGAGIKVYPSRDAHTFTLATRTDGASGWTAQRVPGGLDLAAFAT